MATHDYEIANQTASAFRADLNNALLAIVSQNSGTVAPATTFANMFWYETDTNILWKRNEANSGWIELGTVAESTNKFEPNQTFSTLAEAQAGTDNTRAMTPLRVAGAITAQVAIRSAFTSTNQLITTGGLVTIAHGLGQQPTSTYMELVCITAEYGYVNGDRIVANVNNTTSGTNRINAVLYDPTNIYIRYSNAANCFIAGDYTSGVLVTLTNASWRLRVRAYA